MVLVGVLKGVCQHAENTEKVLKFLKWWYFGLDNQNCWDLHAYIFSFFAYERFSLSNYYHRLESWKNFSKISIFFPILVFLALCQWATWANRRNLSAGKSWLIIFLWFAFLKISWEFKAFKYVVENWKLKVCEKWFIELWNRNRSINEMTDLFDNHVIMKEFDF